MDSESAGMIEDEMGVPPFSSSSTNDPDLDHDLELDLDTKLVAPL